MTVHPSRSFMRWVFTGSKSFNQWAALLLAVPIWAFAIFYDTVWLIGPPPFPRDLPAAVASKDALPVTLSEQLFSCFHGEIRSTACASSSLPFQAGTSKGFAFHRRESLGGYWNASAARISVSYADENYVDAGFRVTGLHSEDWGDQIKIETGSSISDNARHNITTREFLPTMEATILVPPAMVRKWVRVHAEMDITYPAGIDSQHFSNHSETLNSDYRFLAVGSSEYLSLLRRDEWDGSGRSAILLSAFGAFCAAGSYISFRKDDRMTYLADH